ncbi:MAG: hypothetical protein Q8Q05_03520 [bacterium]|nr:hypothetical protein [bacterium]
MTKSTNNLITKESSNHQVTKFRSLGNLSIFRLFGDSVICNSDKRPGNAIIAIVIAVFALIFFAFAIVYYVVFGQQMQMAKSIGEFLFGGGGSAQASPSAAMEPVDCGNGTTVPRIYLPIIKQAAKQYLGGDEAALIALISIEAPGFRRDAISRTGAVGLGQFVAPTAQGIQKDGLFRGLKIIVVPRADKSKKRRVTPAEMDSFRQVYPHEGRLQPNPSIFASAYYFSNALRNNGGNIGKAYAEGYNGSTEIQANGKMEKENAADRVVEVYNNLKKPGGGCKELKDTPGNLGENIRKLTTAK